MAPTDLRFTREHEWVRMDGDDAVMGISDYAQKALGDVTFVELAKVGTKVAQRQELGVVESVKAASDLYAPLAGTVSAVNAVLNDRPEMVNQSPYGDGWMCRLSDVDRAGLAGLMDAAGYDAYVKGLK
jgi:glycine cleavage system H protein